MSVPIKIYPTKKFAEIVINQERVFRLDFSKNEVDIKGKKIKIDSLDIESSNDDILVSIKVLEKWFNLSFGYSFPSMRLIVSQKKGKSIFE